MSRKGKTEKLPQFTPLLHYIMDSPAFAGLSPLAQCLYVRLKRRCGVGGKRNGQVFYAVREAAEDMNVNKNTVGRAFHELQARGFLVPVQIGSLGITGEGKATIWRMTEFEVDRLFLRWKPGQDFPVVKGRSNRPKKQNPVSKMHTACIENADVRAKRGLKSARPCIKNVDVLAVIEAEPVPKKHTPKDMP
jgi:DNA-binding transcriptional MocR family regulator